MRSVVMSAMLWRDREGENRWARLMGMRCGDGCVVMIGVDERQLTQSLSPSTK